MNEDKEGQRMIKRYKKQECGTGGREGGWEGILDTRLTAMSFTPVDTWQG